jgi:cyclopropane-fatty-acyl-phospholipid synthase
VSASASVGTRLVDGVVDRGLLPDALLRPAVRRLLARRAASLAAGGVEGRAERQRRLVADLSSSPVAMSTDVANRQHYEVPTGLFELMLGPHLKYSSGWWPDGVHTLADAEEAMLRLTCQRARLHDGQDVLDLGCGWGSLSLWIAERHPASRVVAVSNSRTQRAHIERTAAARGLENLTVVTADVNDLGVRTATDLIHAGAFDRVVSVELFEHVRNHRELTDRIAGWLRPDGLLFVHVFAHRSDAYPFTTGSSADWMARHFFTGGLMPSPDLIPRLARELDLVDRWAVSGRHYARTLRAWLDRLDEQRGPALRLLGDVHGGAAAVELRRWRVFHLACEELFAYRGGEEWHVSHQLYARTQDRTPHRSYAVHPGRDATGVVP